MRMNYESHQSHSQASWYFVNYLIVLAVVVAHPVTDLSKTLHLIGLEAVAVWANTGANRSEIAVDELCMVGASTGLQAEVLIVKF
jgi:hypothetical protein